MAYRLLASRFSILALVIVGFVLAHDLAMAADPHTPEPGHHAAVEHHHDPVLPACDALEAARASAVTVDPPLAANLAPLRPCPEPDWARQDAPRARSGGPPEQRRARLQVWLI